ncbi:hypothetical protein AB6D17_07085 [Vibrio splendidus]
MKSFKLMLTKKPITRVLTHWFVEARKLINSHMPNLVAVTKKSVAKVSIQTYFVTTVLIIGLLSYAVSLSESKGSVVTLSNYFAGMLTVFSSIGSLLAGIGTIGAVITAVYVSSEWKEQKFLELFFPLATKLEDDLTVLHSNIGNLYFYIKLISLGDFTDQHVSEYQSVYQVSLENKKYLSHIKHHLKKTSYLTKNHQQVKELINLIGVLDFLVPQHDITKLNIIPIKQQSGGEMYRYDIVATVVSKEAITYNASHFEERTNDATRKISELQTSLSAYLNNHI